ncbi:cytochrome P450 [Actinokineospora enzanensis]|uniref:cytochrome P450 n=1 Tax=Actinokineospora enzanensis TaxID=155975 RepID=UPI000378E6D4|nr:cytochrome P450 [Actinokineospora enzanensis]
MTEAVFNPELFNPFAPGFTDNPYPEYARLRDNHPVQEHPLGFWVTTRHADVTAVLRAGLSVENRNLAPNPVRQQVSDAIGTSDSWRRLSMLDRDAPDHTRLRGLVTKVFTPRAIGALEPRIVELVDTALAGLAEAGGGDLVEELAFPLPFTVITEMLGMPPTDSTRVRDLAGLLVRSLEPIADLDLACRIGEADRELSGLVGEVIAWKRANPADDLLTALVRAEHDGAMLSDEELVAQVVLLYVAGHETTVNLVSNGTVALLRHPDQLAALRADPTLIDNAVEELLRFDSPVQSSRRVTTAPFVLDGHEIPVGSFVIATLAAANTDERFWGPDAAELRLDRANARQHVSFGAGPHHCLGAALARMEGRVAIGRLVERFPNLALAGEVTWNGRINLRGAAKVPVSV